MVKELNPFISIGYRGPALFCDREDEKKQLDTFMNQGIHVTLFAIRRLGKTGLIHHVFYPYQKNSNVQCIYLDILPTQELADLVNLVATAVYNHFPAKSTLGKKILEFIKTLRPLVQFDDLSGKPSLTLTLETTSQKEHSLANLLRLLDQQNKRVVFAIDEFQQILSYPEQNTEAILRTIMQELKNTSFIFSGSNQKMMHEIFNSAKRPFFASCANMQLDLIPQDSYSQFILEKFEERKRKIAPECIDFICSWTKRHTFFTQHLCAHVFMLNKTDVQMEDVRQAALNILKLNEPNFYQYKNLLTEGQWKLLCAIAKEEQVTQPQSKSFIKKYELGTPALVKRGLEALLNKELIFQVSNIEKPYYEVYDKFLMRWVQHKIR